MSFASHQISECLNSATLEAFGACMSYLDRLLKMSAFLVVNVFKKSLTNYYIGGHYFDPCGC